MEDINEITPQQAYEQLSTHILIDVREMHEWLDGHPKGATHLPLSQIKLANIDSLPPKDQPINMICGKGVRSKKAAELLIEFGYENVSSVEGGFTKWKFDHLPCED